MSEQGDIGDVSSKVVRPFTSEVPRRVDKIVDEESGYEAVSSHLRKGGLVLLGDTHYESATHDLFQRYEARLIEGGIPFTLAVELPHEINYQIEEKSAEQILEQAKDLYDAVGLGMDATFVRDLTAILDLAKQHRVPIRAIDEIGFKKKPLPEELTGKTQNGQMARHLDPVREEGDSAVLTLVGANHAQAAGLPRHIEALSVKIGEDLHKQYKPGSFDYQIKV
jgi:hypothetical protein